MRRARLSFFAGFSLALGLTLGLGLAMPALAQSTAGSPVTSGFNSFAAAAGFTNQASLPVIIASLIRTFISFLGIVAVALVLYGGFLYMTAGGDENRVKAAKSLLRNAAIGFVLIIASFAIASFVIGQLEKAVGGAGGITGSGGDTGCTTPGCFGDGHVDPRHTFAVKDWNQACGTLLQNYQPQITFTQPVSNAVASNGAVQIKDKDGASVPGTFAVQGSVLTFTPTAACQGAKPGPGSEHCFNADTAYNVIFDSNTFKSATGASLQCGGGFTACAVSFTTGHFIDAARPTAVMTVPAAAGTSAAAGAIVPLQVRIQDDVGGSLAQFFAQDANKPVFSAGLSNSSQKAVVPDNSFDANPDQWNTAGYVPGAYDVWAVASDCAGHTASAAHAKVTLVSAQCSNGVQDPGETGVDCGVSCGVSCAGGACSATAACSVGLTCKDGTCVSTPRIDRVAPNDGAPGNFVTISGAGFGATGSVVFLGDPNNASDDATATVPPSCGTPWSDTQVIVQVPPAAKSGPIELRGAAYSTDPTKADRTDDTFGARLSDFTVNDVVRPGLCEISPVASDGPTNVTLQGINFGASQGSSTVYFGNSTPASYGAWTSSTVAVTSPRLDARAYDVQVFTGDKICVGGSKAGAVCAANADCDAGTCANNRQGSNPLAFTSTPLAATVTPSIVSVDTGWSACDQAGTKNGAHCVVDSECGAGKCVATPTWGPVGQYVTINGTHFGTAGVVRLSDATTGKAALGDVLFPPSCGATALWNDSTAVVKFPAKFDDGSDIQPGTLKLYVDRGGVTSPTVDVQVVPGQPGPGICRIDPTGGKVKTQVTLFGEHFNGEFQTIFRANKIDAFPEVVNEAGADVVKTMVPDGAVTGPLVLKRVTPDTFVSNAVNFQVGSCTDKTLACGPGTQCCANGSCKESCDDKPKTAHYAYLFSTGPIPLAPQVRVQCDPILGVVSPSPWQGWSKPASICPTAPVAAQFDRAMDQTTLVASNVKVQQCTGTDAKNPCATLGAVLAGDMVPGSVTAESFQWKPTQAFGTSKTYQVTLLAAGLKSVSAKNTDGVEIGETSMAGDFSWQFTTSADSAACRVGALMVLPNPFTATEQGQVVDYYATPVSAGDPCVLLACDASYQMQWETGHPNQITLQGPKNQAGLQCDNHALVNGQINDATNAPPEHADNVKAALTSEPGTPSSTAKLIVAFAKPKVVENWPACDTACINGQVGASFNVEMNKQDFTSNTVHLYACQNAVCNPQTRVEINLAQNQIAINYPGSDKAPRLTLEKAPMAPSDPASLYQFQPDTFYQIVLSGKISAARSGTLLAESYGGQDYNWIFRTQKSAQPCGIDKIQVDPASAVAKVVGERTAFTAVPLGAPDSCSPAGQRLDAMSYAWSPWSANDQPVPTPASGATHLIADLLPVPPPGIAGSLALSPLASRLPVSCTAQCLQAGAPVTADQGVCGNGTVDPGEDCDPSAAGTPAGTCSSTCLNVPPPACGMVCDNTTVTPAVFTATSCSSATAAKDCNNVCTTAGTCSITTSVLCKTTADCTTLTCNVPPTAQNCCGNAKKDAGEECDGGPGCTVQCLNVGVGAPFCGNGKLETEQGEECDPAMKPWSDNPGSCSSACQNLGSVPKSQVYATCGNGVVEPGEECDDRNAANGDGCSSRCLHEGVAACVRDSSTNAFVNAPCCGDGNAAEPGKSCDPEVEPWKSNPGSCTASCLKAGSSYRFVPVSFCGDGTVDAASEECDVGVNAPQGKTGPFGVSRILATAVQKVDLKTKLATASVTASAGGKTGTADLSLQCACTTDASCGASGVGCGNGSCCFQRPTVDAAGVVPALKSPIQTNVCRNTALQATFSVAMDGASFGRTCSNDSTKSCTADADCGKDNACGGSNVALELLSVSGAAPTAASCKDSGGSFALLDAPRHEGFFASIVTSVKHLFSSPAVAAVAGTRCLVPVAYDLDPQGKTVTVKYPTLLAANGTYRLVVLGASNPAAPTKVGVRSANQVTLDASAAAPVDGLPAGSLVVTQFVVGSDVCVIDKVNVMDKGKSGWVVPEDPSYGLFTKSGETHALHADALARNGTTPIQPVPGIYAWSWNWNSSIKDTDASNIVTAAMAAGAGTDAVGTAGKANGQETVFAETTVTVPVESNKTPAPLPAFGTKVHGELVLSALLCQNPAAGIPQPYVNADSNFSFFYCRDAGDVNSTDDDLPEISVADKLPQRTLKTPSGSSITVFQESLFKLSGTPDGLGVRVVSNADYLSPDVWYAKQGFRGSPTATTVDGYKAVQDGNTWYVAAPNVDLAKNAIYPNIYIISFNADARPSSKQAFQNILNTWSFNANRAASGAISTAAITNYNLCHKVAGDFVTDKSGSYVSCAWDGDCVDQCNNKVCSVSGVACSDSTPCPLLVNTTFCDAQKAKLRRDTQRLSDVVNLRTALDQFGGIAKHCSVVKAQRCSSDAQCGAGETCVANVPDLAAGTFIRTEAVSAWPSWASTFGNALGTALPTDPLNQFYNCSAAGFDPKTCFNGANSTFQCPDKSHVYGFKSVGGESYTLYAQLEQSSQRNFTAVWNSPIDRATGNASVFVTGAAQATTLPAGFTSSLGKDGFCDNQTVGVSASCGDGVKSPGEACELGEIQSPAPSCKVCSNAVTGVVSQTECTTDASCSPLNASWVCGTSGTSKVCVNSVTNAASQTACATNVECAPLNSTWTCAGSGTKNIPCGNLNNTCVFDISKASACIPFRCGNGIKETGEDCDQGAKNGTYGSLCNAQCKFANGPASGVTFCGDGYLSGGEQCDCGNDQVFSGVHGADWAQSWSVTHACTSSNGTYVTDPAKSCTFDCRNPGPSCGNGVVDGSEQCEKGQTQDVPDPLCAPSRVCVKGDVDKLGIVCAADAVCGTNGSCSAQTYPTALLKTCNVSSCQWNVPAPTAPMDCRATSLPSCGNGKKEGTEQCDDGNTNNNDGCTNECKANVCGDGVVYKGVEACDAGINNGVPCNPAYGSTCAYCDRVCHLVTKTGSFCGDGVINGSEQCDGDAVPFSCVKKDATTNAWVRGAACPPNPDGSATGYTASACKTGETCAKAGICDGGPTNGATCLVPLPGTVDTQCGAGGVCVAPACAADCGSSCPFSYATTALKVTPAQANAQPQDTVSLYSADGTATPSGGLLMIPSCLAGASLTADVDNSKITRPFADVSTVEVVFVTDVSGSMRTIAGGGKSRMQVVKDSLTTAIDTLFDSYPAGQLKIGLVSFDHNPAEPSDQPLSPSSSRQLLKDTVAQYAARTNTGTLKGMQDGIADLGAPAPGKGRFIILLSDGDPDNGVTEVGQVYDLIRKPENSDIGFFSAAVTNQDYLKAYMAHMSSDTCGTNYATPGAPECVPKQGVQYDYAGNDVVGISGMYDSIVAAIVGTTISYGVQPPGGGAPVYSSGGITSGKSVLFPFPQGFKCQAAPFTVPFSTKFIGQDKTDPTKPGQMTFSNFKLTYCPTR